MKIMQGGRRKVQQDRVLYISLRSVGAGFGFIHSGTDVTLENGRFYRRSSQKSHSGGTFS